MKNSKDELTHSKREVRSLFFKMVSSTTILLFWFPCFISWAKKPHASLTGSGELNLAFVWAVIFYLATFVMAVIFITLSWQSVFKKTDDSKT